MKFQLFRPSANLQQELGVTWNKTMPDQGNFNAGGISAVEKLQIIPKDSETQQSFEIINIYPNPGNGLFTIAGVGNAEQILVSSPDGRLVFENIQHGEPVIEINLTGLAKGVYIVKIVGGNTVQTRKIVIE
jgi:hypothetical protein